ncbi:MAG: hypothetical protein UHE86_05860, partial [Acutalibacteraceae bacterium]|nr:hypothetical protein [Acutalibacteraceae bacterium]
MKARSVKYLTGEGLKNVWNNRLMSIASIGVLVACMVLIGISFLITLNAQRAMEGLEQQNVVMVYFNDKNSVLYGTSADGEETSSDSVKSDQIDESSYLVHNDEEALAVCKEIEKLDNVVSVTYVTSDEGLESL